MNHCSTTIPLVMPHPWCKVHWTQFLAYGHTGQVQEYVQAVNTLAAAGLRMESANVDGKGADGAMIKHVLESAAFNDIFREMYGRDYIAEGITDIFHAIWVLKKFSPICCRMSEDERKVLYGRYTRHSLDAKKKVR